MIQEIEGLEAELQNPASMPRPACYCGIVGFKPTYGRVSNRGVLPDSWTLDHIGPMCRNVEDAALKLGVIAGYDQLDPASVDTPVPDYNRAFRMQVKAAVYMQARRQLDLLRRQVKEVFTAVDLLITPTMLSPPVVIAQGADPTAWNKRNTSPFDILGLPAISVPCGFTRSGLPIGLQIVGAPFAESTVMALAHAYEQATEWHRRSPAV